MLKILVLNMLKKFINEGILVSKKFNQTNYGNLLKNQGTEFGKIAGKKILTKSAEATGDLIGSKVVDKINSFKSKEKPEVIEEEQEIIIPPDQRQ